MSVTFGLSPWLIGPAFVLAAALAVWLYRRTTPELPTPKRVVLGLLRFAVLFLVALLLLEPIVRRIEREERPPILAVLIDNTQSILVTSGDDSTGTVVRGRIADVLDNLPPALREADVRFYTFEAGLRPLDGAPADSVRFDGDRTNISSALEELRDRLRNENLQAAVLFSDGQYNTGRNPIYEAERYAVPIYTAVLGDTSRHRDVQVRHVTTNEIAYVGMELPVQVSIRSEDFGGEQPTVSLFGDGALLSSTTVTLPEGSGELTVDLSFTPEEEGLHRYTVSVSRLPGELTYLNNTETFTVRVLETRRQVLLLSAAPGPDVAGVRQLLEMDGTLETSAFIQRSPGAFYEGALPASLDEFDVVVLVGYPGREASSNVMERVASAVEAGIPVFFLYTRDTHLPYVQQYFSAALPALPDRIRPGFVEASFHPALAGANHPVMGIPEASSSSWRLLPPLHYSQSRWQSTPDAITLAMTEIRGIALEDPLFVIRRRAQNRSAALLGAGAWRWRNVPDDLAQFEHLWPTLFSNAMQWLTAREDDRPVRVVPVRDLFGGGEIVRLNGQVYDESLNPVSDATLSVRVRAPDGTVSPYVMNPIGNGRYVLDAGTFPEGTYHYEADAERSELALGSDEGAFAVGALTLEFKETRANAEIMRQIAARSGGEVLEPGPAADVAARLVSTGSLASIVVEQERDVELRHRYAFLAIIILLLTAEWLVRKRSGMV